MANENVTPGTPPVIETVTVTASRLPSLLKLAALIGLLVFIYHRSK